MTEAATKPEKVEAFLVAGITLTAAAVLPGHRLGIGVSLVGLAYAWLIFGRGTGERVRRLAFIAVGLVLLSSAALRDATWIVIPSVIAGALLLVSTVIFLGRLKDLVVVAGIPFRLIHGWRTATTTVMGAIPPDTGKKIRPVLRGLSVGIPLLALFSALFVTADRAFAHLAEDALLIDVDLALVPARIAVGCLAGTVAGALLWASGERSAGWSWRLSPFEAQARDRAGAALLEWVLPLGMLVLLFAAFVAVQATVLFGGRTYVLRTAGLTYAEYARSGFFQLLVVGALVLVVIGAARHWVRPAGGRQSLVLELLLGSLASLSIVILVSALYRLHLYVDAYGLTRARFGARLVMIWLAILLAGAIARGFVQTGPWLVRGVALASAAVILTGVAQDPDAAIARAGVERWEATGRIDVAYLSGLSADAVPELSRLPDPLRSCVLYRYSTFSGEETWSGWNVSRARARFMVQEADLRSAETPRCPQVDR